LKNTALYLAKNKSYRKQQRAKIKLAKIELFFLKFGTTLLVKLTQGYEGKHLVKFALFDVR
jgi:hypothetical protein